MNCNDDLEMLSFDKNDMKVIEQNDTQVEKVYASQQPIRSLPAAILLKESIFLRYLPLPMIIKTLLNPDVLID